MLGHSPAFPRRHPMHEEVQDAPGPRQIDFAPGRFMGRQQSLDTVHVGIHPAIARKRRPVPVPFIAEKARSFLPEMRIQHLCGVVDQPVCLRVSGQSRSCAGQKHEHMAVSQFAPVKNLVTLQRPDIAAVIAVSVVIDEIAHALIDHRVAIGLPGQFAKRIGMHHPRGRMQFLPRVGQRSPLMPKDMETRDRVTGGPEKAKLAVRVGGKPGAVRDVVKPETISIRPCGIHEVLHALRLLSCVGLLRSTTASTRAGGHGSVPARSTC